MRFRRTKHDRVLVVGIFQSPKTGRAVLKNLHRTQFRRAAAIHASVRGRLRVEENGISAIGGSAATAAFGLALGAFIFWQRGMLADYRLGGLASRGECRRPRARDPGQPRSEGARAILSAPVARDRAGAGMGKRKPNDVSRSAPRLHPLGGVAAR